jgi:hypothetical protein
VEGVGSRRAKLDSMTENEASRTLVKSPPELWAECSDASSLARHLGQFGDIRITRLEPETAVAWEGEDVSGTVRLEPSGWGTRVILTVRRPEAPAAKLVPVPDLEPEPELPPQPEPTPPPAPPPAAVAEPVREAPVAEERAVEELVRETPPEVPVRLGFFARLFGRRRPVVDEVEPPAPEPAAVEPRPKLTAPAHEPAPEPRPIAPAPEPRPIAPAPEPRPITLAPEPESELAGDSTAALTAALDSLGQAHHRPFSRS